MQQAHEQHQESGRSSRVFQELTHHTRKTWSTTRRVVAKAEVLPGKTNPRFVVTSLSTKDEDARTLYKDSNRARGEMPNRIKECQLDRFADGTSTATLRANQLRLWLSSFAYVLTEALRCLALQGTALANATAGSMRIKLLKIGAVSVQRVKVAMSSAFPHQATFDPPSRL